MTSALLESPPISLFTEGRRADSARGRGATLRRADPASGRGATLEELLDRTLRAVHAEGQAECPVCHASMRREDGTGRCTGCGSALA